ncbi:MAG: 6-bladed beta-propeller, partial [Bacteroidales bacterium]|nr:6-bladed beta-propeller [Bacteroidales bacterium]
MKQIVSLFALVVCLLFISCKSDTKDDGTIKVEFGAPIENFTELIESVEYIPLETDMVFILDGEPELYLGETDYYVVNKKDYNLNHGAYRYSPKGEYLNSFGSKGRGPGEYVRICDFQPYKDTILIFSDNKMLKYKTSGDLISEASLSSYGDAFICTEEGNILTYYGYGSLKSYRFSLETAGDTTLIERYFDSENNRRFISMVPFAPIFSENGTKLTVLDPINPVVYIFEEKRLNPYLIFDFGKYDKSKQYYAIDDVYKSIEFLESSDYAVIHRYLESDLYKIVEINVASEEDYGGLHYGLYKDEKWHWFKGGNLFGENAFDGTFRCLFDDTLYFIMTPMQVKHIPDKIAALALNPEAVANIKDEDN